MRHGRAEAASDQIEDEDRSLTPEGIAAVHSVADRFTRRRPSINYIMTSSAQRARQTATIMAAALAFPQDQILAEQGLYDLSGFDSFSRILTVHGFHSESLLCIMHNPALEELVSSLSKVFTEKIPAGGLIALTLPIGTWQEIQPGKAAIDYTIFP
jgi:phosphohistidine phosphatase